MERIKINLPEHFSFSTKIAIRITDMNYGGHVGNDSFLTLIHEARQQFLQHYGYSELNMEGVGLIMTDAAIEFKKELTYGDALTIYVTARGFDKLGFDIYYLLETEHNGVKAIAGKAKTGMLCFDYALKKKVVVPEQAVQKLSA
ncbi:MAG: thioesterase family protein [Bacteroidota bacterium]|nr:thioesterase family protein [Bacteroidota bacterium]